MYLYGYNRFRGAYVRRQYKHIAGWILWPSTYEVIVLQAHILDNDQVDSEQSIDSKSPREWSDRLNVDLHISRDEHFSL